MVYQNKKQDKKGLVKRLNELTGVKGNYTGLPECAYDYGTCRVERDGSLTTSGSMDLGIIRTLMVEDWIDGEMPDEPESELVQTVEFTPEREEAEEQEEAPGFIKPQVAFPLEAHTSRSIENLLFLIHSRGHLICKSTGGKFSVVEELIDELKSTPEMTSKEELIEKIRAFEERQGKGVKGIEFTEDRLLFTGFPATDDQDWIQTYMKLASLMNKQALTQNRIHPKKIREENEKYAMRTWLIRIGMIGEEYKDARGMLMENLDGHTAFRTQEDAERWKARQKAIRQAQKEEVEAEPSEENPEGGQ